MADTLFAIAQKEAFKAIWIKNLYLAPKGYSFNYIRYRVLRPILKGYYKLFNLFYPNRPWTTPASIRFFDKVLTKEMIGLEYGSGRSTLYFSNKLKKLVSIEHYEGWYAKVNTELENNSIKNVDYFLILKEDTPDKTDDSDIELNKLVGSEPRNDFTNYYNKVLAYEDGYFDFVLIDGRARVKCGLNAITKLKSGGIFVLDNSERPRYEPLHSALSGWPKVETTSGLTNTTIWIKP